MKYAATGATPLTPNAQTPVGDLPALLAAQRADFLRQGPPSAEARGDRVDRLILLLTENAREFSDAINSDFGNRPEVVNLVSDIAGMLPDLVMTRKKLKSWMRPTAVLSGAMIGMPTVVEKRPVGVVGIIGPWNYPVGLVVEPAASALAAGNRVMIKISEVTPHTAEVFAAAAMRYFAPEELTVVTGGPEVGAAFSALPFDHIFFTGSPRVGAMVAAAAAQNLVPVTLELGGKNPAVVSSGADITATAARIMSARLVNGGQLCLCPEYAFVPFDHVNDFIDAALEVATTAASIDNGLVSIVNERNFERVSALIDDARTRGATVCQAPVPADRRKRQIPPTILHDVDDTMRITGEEVFGPVLTVYPYKDIETAVSYVNNKPTPLAAYWYGPKDAAFGEFRCRVASGGMTVNDFALHCAVMAAPFGGLGRSGWGAYHGKTGFDTFSHNRTVTTSRLPVSLAKLLTPPYSQALKQGVLAYIAVQQRKAARRLSRRDRITS